jgi:hypothetical protein
LLYSQFFKCSLTILDDFGRLFTMDRFFENYRNIPHFKDTFSTVKVIYFLQEKGLGYILADFHKLILSPCQQNWHPKLWSMNLRNTLKPNQLNWNTFFLSWTSSSSSYMDRAGNEISHHLLISLSRIVDILGLLQGLVSRTQLIEI